ncbi:MAG: hypothetical protein ACI9AR_000327 [Flavobacteriaceae bacterium]|jgi:hypothetical protein
MSKENGNETVLELDFLAFKQDKDVMQFIVSNLEKPLILLKELPALRKKHFRNANNYYKSNQISVLLGYKTKSLYLKKVTEDWDQQCKEFQQTRRQVPALVLWKFFRSIHEDVSVLEKHAFLKNQLKNENAYIRLVSCFELLPDDIFRKILWKENIDFLSFESFLRRVKPEQIEAIEMNYNDLCSGSIPRVYKKGLRDRVRIACGKLKLNDLFKNESYYGESRYKSKGSWAYSLFSLDFGFSRYPNGISDDSEIKDIRPSRFLSIKNHINDFVVNKEFGKYWLLYRKARSNYVVSSKKEIVLSSHICPGFWWTFFVHFLFWFVSPVLFALSFINGIPSDKIYVITAIVSGCFTPLWIMLGVLKYLGMKLMNVAGGKGKAIKDFFEKYDIASKVVVGIGRIVLSFFACVALGITYEMISGFLLCGFGIVTSVLFSTSIMFYLVILIRSGFSGCYLSDYFELPKWIQFMAPACIMLGVVQFVDLFWIDSIIDFFLDMLVLIQENVLEFIVLCLPFIGISIDCIFISFSKKKQRKFAKLSKIATNFSKLFLSLTVLSIVWILNAYSITDTISSLFLLIIVFHTLSFFVLNNIAYEINLKTIDFVLKAQDIEKKFSEYSDANIVLKAKQIKKYPWFAEMTDVWQESFLQDCMAFRHYVVNQCDSDSLVFLNSFMDSVLELCLQNKNSSRLYAVRDIISSIMEKYSNSFINNEEILLLIESVFSGMDRDNAEKQISLRFDKKEQKKQHKRNRSYSRSIFWNKYIKQPVSWIFYPLTWLIGKIVDFFKTARNLWILFNERCPSVTEERDLRRS